MKSLILIATMFVFTVSACKSTKETVVDEGQEQVEQRTAPRGDRGDRGPRGGGDRGSRITEMFARMDANNDGKLAKSEVQGPFAERFEVIDVNKDGFVTKEEMQNAPRPQGGRRPGGF